jgi:hypothetical protein
MDTFTFLVAILFIMLALQYNQNWIVAGIVAIMIISSRSITTTITLIIAVIVMYFFAGSGNFNAYWPWIVFGLIILALVLGIGKKESQPEYYSPDAGYGGFGGM